MGDRTYSVEGVTAQDLGANLEEADGAASKADFTAKCCISLKEARESRYWLSIAERRNPDLDLK